ncbi:MAG: zinc metalloprotease HtpX [Candidatus Taylorbacteria bacterium RIFCSPHIGHO2_01_FULL_46_22b]|uniref:Protease HtpX homolog n=1 Tax=Candidatus Taylorbacteria bacterium RIFCSPHIGHO2_01_FULL_46_22b TaxID=1802301 RepID=A0A1G2M352_9BACT|nr:MAG: zinc metalloprotease HtpX [Candidatus Taylorbacteria bacterium RIFCSPHIGHO2_01_FULL_46_22b]
MATLYTHIDSNIRKTWILMSVFFALVVGIGWFLSFYFQSVEILYFALFISVVTNIGSYWFSDKLVIAMTRARPVTREENPVLWNIVENLSITAGLPMPRLYIVEDSAPNAFATGRNKEHAALAVTSGLLTLLDRTELEGVIAHELSHIGNRDILVSTVVVVLAGLVVMVSDFFLRFHLLGGRSRDSRGGQAGAILFVVGIFSMILAPIIATVIKLAVSRKREFLADASGSLLTRYPEGLARALGKISQYGGKMQHASNATAHLFIANPFGSANTGRAGFFQKLFMTHPPVQERVKALLGDHGV